MHMYVLAGWLSLTATHMACGVAKAYGLHASSSETDCPPIIGWKEITRNTVIEVQITNCIQSNYYRETTIANGSANADIPTQIAGHS